MYEKCYESMFFIIGTFPNFQILISVKINEKKYLKFKVRPKKNPSFVLQPLEGKSFEPTKFTRI
jgi:hypothetical protein